MTEVDRTRYALSAEDNDRIFHEEIVPRFLAPATPQRDPVAVFLGGQTGAGKSAPRTCCTLRCRDAGHRSSSTSTSSSRSTRAMPT